MENTNVIEQAITFATKAHKGQVRKGTTRPFIEHPLEVGKIVSTLTFSPIAHVLTYHPRT